MPGVLTVKDTEFKLGKELKLTVAEFFPVMIE
jgi:hypothetical protein